MKSELLLDAVGEVRDDLILDAAKPVYHKRRLYSLSAAAACAVLLLALIGVWRSPKAALSLPEYISSLGIISETVDPPTFISAEEPQLSAEDILSAVKSHLTVEGVVSSLDTVRIPDGGQFWYITTADIQIQSVLSGKTGLDTVRIVTASCVGRSEPLSGIPSSQLVGCREGMKGVFVLAPVGGDSWSIAGKEISPRALGEYHVSLLLERAGDSLFYPGQDITVPLP